MPALTDLTQRPGGKGDLRRIERGMLVQSKQSMVHYAPIMMDCPHNPAKYVNLPVKITRTHSGFVYTQIYDVK